MTLTVLASGSKANCYVIQNESEALIIEAGVCFKEVQKSLDFNISKVVGCLVTHEHSDHCKYINSFLKYEIDVYASIGTISKLNITKKKKPIELIKYQCNEIGNFLVFPFDTNHDYEDKVKEPIVSLSRKRKSVVYSANLLLDNAIINTSPCCLFGVYLPAPCPSG